MLNKIIRLTLITIIMTILLIGCATKIDKSKISFSFDESGKYTGLSDIPLHYLIKDAIKDGCYVIQDSVPLSNGNIWSGFIETTSKGNNSGIRIVNFYTEDSSSPYYNDLFFHEGRYYLFDKGSHIDDKSSFKYMLSLKGRFGMPLKDHEVVVLTDDKALTFDAVMKSFYSSSAEYIQSVSPFRLVMF